MPYSDESLKLALETGFVNKEVPSDPTYSPALLLNDKEAGTKVLSSMIHELASCQEYWFSVAFITTSGVATLMNTLQENEQKKVKGKILASQYLNFTHPQALKRIRKFKNIEIRVETKSSFHGKGYIFKHKDYYNLIIGSSNLTGNALCSNKELNIKTTAGNDSLIVEKLLEEFNSNFNDSQIVDDAYLNHYEEIYKKALREQVIREANLPLAVKPNAMQLAALSKLEALRQEGKSRAIIISATGTGKTYLSAFDVEKVGAKKFLFIVHRRNIAKKALYTFRAQLGDKLDYGLYSGEEKNTKADYLFSTVQTITQEENLKEFQPDHFDYIVIDETHRSGAESYKRILNYFKPKFLLGMTATPERTDGYDIFQQFNHDVAYEIRLHKALEENMLAPFHYYGVTDMYLDGKLVDENTSISQLTKEERVKQIIEKSQYYGTDSGIMRCLVFCRSIKECEELSKAFNLKGLKSVYLTGESSDEERENAIKKLEADPPQDTLQYIFTFDIFNEGVDIPRVNQIILLRPTSSSIVFVQQIGRGLRKTEGKEYLTIIDFIGNYKNNYLVPIALYGDSSYNKDTLRKLMVAGSTYLPGASTVNFDRIAKERIFDSINKNNLSLWKDLKEDYYLLKYRLGYPPRMVNFLDYGMRDPWHFVDKPKSYFNAILKIDDTIVNTLSKNHTLALQLYSKEINNGISLIESKLLFVLLKENQTSVKAFSEALNAEYNIDIKRTDIEKAINSLNFEYAADKVKEYSKASSDILVIKTCQLNNETIKISDSLKKLLDNEQFRFYLEDSTEYSIKMFESSFNSKQYRKGFILYNKYKRRDVLRVLGWEKALNDQLIGGYIINRKLNVCPIFVTYHKSEEISDTIKFEDSFLSNGELIWYSKGKRTLSSPDVKTIRENKELRIPLFVKKSDDDGSSFYYLGDVTPVQDSFIQKTMPTEKKGPVSVVEMHMKLHELVGESLYEYITSK